MSAPGKLVRSSRCKSGPSNGQHPLGSEGCVTTAYEARDLLASVYDWFTEGFGTPVLKEAKALLDQLTA